MPKFVTIGYGDEAGYLQTPAEIRNAAHAHDAKMVEQGAIMGVAGAPVQVRNTEDRGTTSTDGAFMGAALPIAGFAIIDAADLDEAIQMVSKSPCAVAHGVVEVWPLESSPG
jgi:hypothetical protein